jgi:peptide/nickel transport system permease protein
MTTRHATIERTSLLSAVSRTPSALWKFLKRYPIISFVVLTTLIVLGVFAPLLAPHNPYMGSINERFVPPAWLEGGSTDHLLGTDHAGRDIWSRIMYGARISLLVASIALTSGFIIGTSLGLLAGYFGKWWDEVIMRFVDVVYAVPFLMIALVVIIVFGQSFIIVLFLLGMLAWTNFVRIVRANTLVVKRMDYVALAKVSGASTPRILARHILPMVLNAAMVLATMDVGHLILAEASLSFLGAGVPSPTPAWGTMVAEGRNYIASSWWEAFFPGSAIFLVVLSLNFFGDWVRDRLDPRLRQST